MYTRLSNDKAKKLVEDMTFNDPEITNIFREVISEI